jgi:hypothetical protein
MPSYIDFTAQQGPANWARHLISTGSKKEKRRKLGILFTFSWNIWKERNRRIFQGKELSVLQLVSLIQEDLAISRLAFCPDS